MILKKLIKEIESHTGESFDLNNKRHFLRLDSKLERLYSNEVRKLNLIKEVLASKNNEDSIFNSGAQYLQNRYKD